MKSIYYCLILVIHFTGLIRVVDAQVLQKEKRLTGTFAGKWLNTTTTIDSGDTLVFDMSQMVCVGSYLEIPISVISDDTLYSVDFSIRYNYNKIIYDTIIDIKPYLSAAANFNIGDSTLRFTSFSFVQDIEHNVPIATVRFDFLSGPVLAADFNSIIAYLNGEVCSYKFIDPVFLPATITAGGSIIILPGDSVSLTANSGFGYSFLWSNGATTQSIVVNNTGAYTVTVTNLGGCSSTAFQNVYVLAPLPVQLIDFNLTKANDGILVSWTTANELNNEYFTVERSSNNVYWQELNKVLSSGNTNIINNYSFKDVHPLNGINYYRLKQTDFNGNYKYSQILFYNFSGFEDDDLRLSVYPNPVTNMINAMVSENAIAQLITINGDVILTSISLISNLENQIDIQHLEAGIYFLKVQNERKIKVEKIILTKQ